jgi:hypothetical protein
VGWLYELEQKGLSKFWLSHLIFFQIDPILLPNIVEVNPPATGLKDPLTTMSLFIYH